MNTNLVHNILNFLIFVSGLATVLGCKVNAVTGVYDCSASMIGPVYGAYAALAFGAIKLAINILRDGFSGLTKPQPPVAKAPSQ